MDIPVEKKFKILCEISRASHFAWREAVLECCPDVRIGDVVKKMWEITGRETGQAYLKRIDPAKPIPEQIANSIAWSSQTMGEDAEVLPGSNDEEAFVKHDACPWLKWHEKHGALLEDRMGCDAWFEATIDEINKELKTHVQFETRDALPDGGHCCLRRIWAE